MDQFQTLVKALSDALGPSSGIDSDDVDPQQLIDLMNTYTSDPAEWEQYNFSDPGKAYTRNLVDEGNGKSNLLIVVWQPGKSTPIHDHANAHCVMKILKGSLRETVYSYPSSSSSSSSSSAATATPTPTPGTTSSKHSSFTTQTTAHAPHIVKETVYRTDETTYIADTIGLHKISNASDSETAVSLHLYTPPHAANFGFNIFEPTTGKKSHITCYPCYSKYGKKLNKDASSLAAESRSEANLTNNNNATARL